MVTHASAIFWCASVVTSSLRCSALCQIIVVAAQFSLRLVVILECTYISLVHYIDFNLLCNRFEVATVTTMDSQQPLL